MKLAGFHPDQNSASQPRSPVLITTSWLYKIYWLLFGINSHFLCPFQWPASLPSEYLLTIFYSSVCWSTRGAVASFCFSCLGSDNVCVSWVWWPVPLVSLGIYGTFSYHIEFSLYTHWKSLLRLIWQIFIKYQSCVYINTSMWNKLVKYF